jgi:ribosomal protein L32
MNRSRIIGIVLIALGLIIAVFAGLWLAFNVANGQGASDAFSSAGVLFVPIALLVGVGIYQYARSSREFEDNSDSVMRQQREMMDILRGSTQPQRMTDVAAQLGVGVESVGAMMNELIRLGLFSGCVNWQTRVVQVVDAETLRRLRACANCGESLRIYSHTVCPNCGTEYFFAEDGVQSN